MSATMGSIIVVFGCRGATQAQVGRSEGLNNPDLASEKELLAMPHTNAAIVKSIMERRPFLRMTDLTSLLAQWMSKEQLAELYGKMFVTDQPQYSHGGRDPHDSGYWKADAS
jgi:hypothetical protein